MSHAVGAHTWSINSSQEDRLFFERFSKATEEIKRLKAQCRAASEGFGASKEDHVNLVHVKNSIEAAKETSKFAVDALKPEDNGNTDRFVSASKAWLGHLHVPTAGAEHRYRTNADGKRAAAEGWQGGGLPGQVDECFRETDEDGSPPSPRGQDVTPMGIGMNPFADDNDLDRDIGGMMSDEESRDDDLDANSVGDRRRGSGGGLSNRSGSDVETPESQAQKWRAKPPLLRFKNRLLFSAIFKPKVVEEEVQEIEPGSLDEVAVYRNEDIKDPMIGWVNFVFAMNIETEYQFEVGFPLIVLTVLDAIYPKRVKWHKVDWRIQYKRALQNNYQVLEKIWSEVNMEKSREFRFEQTSIRMEHMSRASMGQKLEFVRLLKRWFDQRIHHAGPFDPIKNRREYVEASRLRGLPVVFPTWMKFGRSGDKAMRKQSTQLGLYRAMPEYKRFIWFLGSPEHQTM